MLNPEDRYDIWESFANRARKFFSDVEDALDNRFAPYQEPEDQDTLEMRKLFNMLADLTEFLEEKKTTADKEYTLWDTEQSNKYRNFEAWSLGLCPQVMQKIGAYFDLWHVKWDKIARLKQKREIDKQDTVQAVELCKAQLELERKVS